MTDKLKVVAYLNHRACMPPFLDFFASAGTIRAEPLVLQSEAQAALDAALERVKVLEAILIDARQELIGTHDFLQGGMSGSTVAFTVKRIDAAMEVKHG